MIDWRHFNTLILYHLPILVISLNSNQTRRQHQLPEDLLNPILAAAALGDFLGVLALAAAGRRARQSVWSWLRARTTLRITLGLALHPWKRVCRVPRIVRRELASSLKDIYVDESFYSFDAERNLRDRPLYLYMYWEATLAAQRLLPLFELGSPRHYRDGILWRVCIYERHLGDYGLET